MSDNASFCLNCTKRPVCKEICPELEAILPKPRSGGHRKEFPIDPNRLDFVIKQGFLRKRFGGKKDKITYNNAWESEIS